MTTISRIFTSQRFFTFWFGVGVPILLAGALVIAFLQSIWLGVALTAAMLAWLYGTARTTCSRCPFYGTGRCGLPSLVAPRIFARRSDPLSRGRIRFHMGADLMMMAVLNVIFALEPVFLPAVLLWSIVALSTVYGPKRFHGMLFQLKAGSTGLPLVEPPSVSFRK